MGKNQSKTQNDNTTNTKSQNVKDTCIVYEKRVITDYIHNESAVFTHIYWQKHKLVIVLDRTNNSVINVFLSDTDGTEEYELEHQVVQIQANSGGDFDIESTKTVKGENMRTKEISETFLNACLQFYEYKQTCKKEIKSVLGQLE